MLLCGQLDPLVHPDIPHLLGSTIRLMQIHLPTRSPFFFPLLYLCSPVWLPITPPVSRFLYDFSPLSTEDKSEGIFKNHRLFHCVNFPPVLSRGVNSGLRDVEGEVIEMRHLAS